MSPLSQTKVMRTTSAGDKEVPSLPDLPLAAVGQHPQHRGLVLECVRGKGALWQHEALPWFMWLTSWQ